ncbi:MAG: DUF4430 domain-containing protein [Actinobacteria bacterium]|nr:MAG: DUF4430 domain-containing protein [Actinomycetota bacterium]
MSGSRAHGRTHNPRLGRAAPAIALATSAIGLAAVSSLTGCGLGAGPAPGGVHLTVTRDFGSTSLRSWSAPRVRGQETVMSLLLRNAAVGTRYGGGFVQSIDGVAGGREDGRPVDWFYYVNGREAPQGAASTNVNPGDYIWWDRHDWSQTDHIPAVVGSFPEPFLNGIAGKRLPVRIECAVVAGRPCRTVTSRLRAEGVPAAVAALQGGGAPLTLRVLVAPWKMLKSDPVAGAIQRGPAASGVFARFAADGSTLTLLDPDGRPTDTLRAGAGLIAATASEEHAPVWVISGTDAAGLEHAASSFDQPTLQDRFAVAVTATGNALLTKGVPR